MYSNSRIYKLQCNDGYYYIGSTVNELRKRLWGHKTDSKKRNNRLYQHINQIGWDNVKIILIEEFSCENKEQLHKKEDEYIQTNKDDEFCLNMVRAFQTKEELKEWHKKYQQDNKEEIKEYQKQNYQKKLKEIKQYYEINKEKIKEQHRERYLKKKLSAEITNGTSNEETKTG